MFETPPIPEADIEHALDTMLLDEIAEAFDDLLVDAPASDVRADDEPIEWWILTGIVPAPKAAA